MLRLIAFLITLLLTALPGLCAAAEGEVFRFVRKPCSAPDLARIIMEGLSEREH